jgi:hypothetical protein
VTARAERPQEVEGTTLLGKRRIHVDEETRRQILLAAPRLGYPPPSYLFGPNASAAIRVALEFARQTGIEPAGEPMVTNGAEPFKVDTRGLFEETDLKAVAQILRLAIRRYLQFGAPSDKPLFGRSGTWLSVPRSLLQEIAINAFASRKVSEVEAVETLEEAMRRVLRELSPDGEKESPWDVRLRIDSGLYDTFRERAGRAGMDAESLLWREAHEITKERRVRA